MSATGLRSGVPRFPADVTTAVHELGVALRERRTVEAVVRSRRQLGQEIEPMLTARAQKTAQRLARARHELEELLLDRDAC